MKHFVIKINLAQASKMALWHFRLSQFCTLSKFKTRQVPRLALSSNDPALSYITVPENKGNKIKPRIKLNPNIDRIGLELSKDFFMLSLLTPFTYYIQVRTTPTPASYMSHPTQSKCITVGCSMLAERHSMYCSPECIQR